MIERSDPYKLGENIITGGICHSNPVIAWKIIVFACSKTTADKWKRHGVKLVMLNYHCTFERIKTESVGLWCKVESHRF